MIQISDGVHLIESRYDSVIPKEGAQSDVYEFCRGSVLGVMEGFNCTIFAYGQTGSGKTYTMFGPDWEEHVAARQSMSEYMRSDGDYFDNTATHGCIPRSVTEIFQAIDERKANGEKFTVYCSFLQIYNEKLYDLLQDTQIKRPLAIRED